VLAPLPLAVALKILALLPVDCRLRCAEVSRAWRAALTDCGVWARLDFSPTNGVVARVTNALLLAAAARAGGALQALDLSNCNGNLFEALLRVVADTDASMTLRMRRTGRVLDMFLDDEQVRTLCAAPQLQRIEADVRCRTREDAVRMLRCEPPFGPLRVHRLLLFMNPADDAGVLALASAVLSNTSLRELAFVHAPLHTPAALDVLVDAVVARRLSSLNLASCRLSPASVPALIRLVRDGALKELLVKAAGGDEWLLDVPGALQLGDALRANSTLTWLRLGGLNLWHDDSTAATIVLLTLLVDHRSLRKVHLGGNAFGAAARAVSAGAVLQLLVAANTPALEELFVDDCQMGDAELGLLVDALPRNTHLRTLCCDGNATSEAFARDRLLPAVRANSSLRSLKVDASPVANEVVALVARRTPAAAAGRR
jgi:hypothetical protein